MACVGDERQLAANVVARNIRSLREFRRKEVHGALFGRHRGLPCKAMPLPVVEEDLVIAPLELPSRRQQPFERIALGWCHWRTIVFAMVNLQRWQLVDVAAN